MLRPELREYIEPGSPEESVVQAIDMSRLPRHVAVIMDGNGRWAARHQSPRVFGHRAGIKAVREVVEASARLGLEVLTLFAFSRENWKRPADEVRTLMALLKDFVRDERPTLARHRIRFRVIGRRHDLAADIQEALAEAEEASRTHERMVFNVALSYGGRTEIVDACNAVVADVVAGRVRAPLGEEDFARYLYTAGLPDPDLLIRTSGEYRVSNFLLWQIAYSEMWITDTLWPDFRRGDLFRAVLEYQGRQRRYGGV